MSGLLIVLPQGRNASGVTLWGVRLANALCDRGWSCGLLLHREPEGQSSLEVRIDPRVRLFEHPELPPAGEGMPPAEALVPAYRSAVEQLGGISGGPVVVSPNLHGEVYGACAALTRTHDIRLVGWQHSDIAYDARVLGHYAPALHGMVAVSTAIEGRLAESLGVHADRLERIAYGVEDHQIARPASRGGRAMRLVYTGRMEHHQKRILALVEMARVLDRRGVPYELMLVGDGPASAEVDAAIKGLPRVMRVGASSPVQVQRWLVWADAMVLGSRYEGLSVSVLEAMMAGCTVVLTRTRSGSAEAIEHGVTGLLAEVAPEAGEVEAGEALGEQVARLHGLDVAAMGAAARGRARGRYTLKAHAHRVEALLARAVLEPARVWPTDRPIGFAAGGGTVPPDASERMARVLSGLRGRRVAVHGAGAHTLACAQVLAGVAAILDDDRGRWGSSVAGVRVCDPSEAPALGITDVVLSSHLHEGALWERRGVYEARGIRVHRLYAETDPRTQAA